MKSTCEQRATREDTDHIKNLFDTPKTAKIIILLRVKINISKKIVYGGGLGSTPPNKYVSKVKLFIIIK